MSFRELIARHANGNNVGRDVGGRKFDEHLGILANADACCIATRRREGVELGGCIIITGSFGLVEVGACLGHRHFHVFATHFYLNLLQRSRYVDA